MCARANVNSQGGRAARDRGGRAQLVRRQQLVAPGRVVAPCVHERGQCAAAQRDQVVVRRAAELVVLQGRQGGQPRVPAERMIRRSFHISGCTSLFCSV